MNTADARVVLVGSLPFGDAEETFRAAGRSLNGYIGWIPDGEFGERKLWTPMLPEFVYSKQPDLEETLAPPGRTVAGAARLRRASADRHGRLSGTSGSSRGHRLRFDDLLYGRIRGRFLRRIPPAARGGRHPLGCALPGEPALAALGDRPVASRTRISGRRPTPRIWTG